MADKKRRIEFELTANDAKLKASFNENKKLAKETEEQAKASVVSIQSLFQAIGGAVVFSKIKGFFNDAFEASKRLEASLARVESAARAMGQGTTAAKNAAIELTKDGFLNLNQAAGSLSNLMQSGLNLDQSVKFVEAAKNVSAFNNTIGDASQSVEDLTAGIIKNSAEVIENASPTLKLINQKYQALLTSQGKAIAVQYLYTAMLKEGNKFAGDAARYLDTAAAAEKRFKAETEAASAAIGKGLSPALKAIYDGLGSVVKGFTDWYSNLSKGSQAIIGVTGLLLGFIPAVGALIPVLNALGFTFAKTWTAALGPIGLIIAALGLLAVAANAVYDVYKKGRGETLLDQRKAIMDEVNALALNKKNVNELNEAKARLKAINKEISDSYDSLLKKYNLENAAYATKLHFIQQIDTAERNLGGRDRIAGMSDRELSDRITELRRSQREVAARPSSVLSARDRREMDVNTRAEIDTLLNEQERRRRNPTAPKPADPVELKGTEARFIEAQKQLLEIEKNRIYTIANIKKGISKEERDRQKQNAEDDAKQQALNAIGQYRVAWAEYTEEKLIAEIENNNKAGRDAVRASIEVLNAELNQAGKNEAAIAKAKEANELRLYKIRDAYAKKNIEAYAKSFSETLNTAKGVADSVAKVRSGDVGGGVAGILSGSGSLGESAANKLKDFGILSKDSKLGSVFGSLGMAGQVFGSLMSLGSAIGGLFGKSDAQRAQEAAEQKQRDDEAKVLLEASANYQKSMLALQEAQAKLPFENMSRELRLIDIKAQQQSLAGVAPDVVEKERLQARLKVSLGTLSGQSSVISQGRLFQGTGASPEELIKMLNLAGAQSPSIDVLSGLLSSAATASSMTGGPAISFLEGIAGQIAGQRGSAPDAAVDEAQNAVQEALQKLYEYRNWSQGGSNQVERLMRADYFNKVAVDRLTINQSGFQAVQSEFRSDVSVADNLLSVIEQSNQVQLEIAANTKKTAENTSLQGQREMMFLDIAGGGLRGFGQLLRANYSINTSALGLPSGVSNTILASQAAKTVEEKSLDRLTEILNVNKDMARFLGDIAVNIGRMSGGSNVAGTQSEFEQLKILEGYENRS